MTAPDPLFEWNRLENENTMHSLVAEMYLGMLVKSPQIETFATWLLAGVGATASLIITNAESITKALSPEGFKAALYCLIASALCGLLAKAITVFFPSNGKDHEAFRAKLMALIVQHGEERKKIEAAAKERDVVNLPDLEISEMMREFVRPLPFWTKWVLAIYLRKIAGERNADLHLAVKGFIWQVNLCFLQLLGYIAFLGCVAHYVRAI